jgi:hypothetical protein
MNSHYHTNHAMGESLIRYELTALVLSATDLCPQLSTEYSSRIWRRTFANALSMLSFGTPEALAALSVAASAAFFSGSVDPPSSPIAMSSEVHPKLNEIKRTASGHHDILRVKL